MAMPPPICFLKGTRIWTPDGESRVEDLRINDLVITSSGEAKPIKWLGRLQYERQRGQKWTKGIAPIRVARSALGPNTPHRDLYLTENHRLYLDGALISAVHLLNNSTITRWGAEDLQEIEYFHIKLERHSVIYAEGAASETMLGNSMASCDNFEEYRSLYGEPSFSDEPACAPVLGYNGGRARLRGRIRSVVSHVIDVRSKLEIVRGNLGERARSSRGLD
jgi:Hint domain